eukprot:Phypoly_transcript_00363.p1 GENE.Phypoly_transcript_00363~~Phypoly_transcript_00363.p1  ORF type:complete len:599 (+),score=58.14 Phypoly_transcript_00363:3228-5024(+)
MGTFCNIINTCASTRCEAGCEYDSDYNQICCHTGYTLTNHTCKDVNECENRNACSPLATCNNTIGGFDCKCHSGLVGNGSVCTACTHDACHPLVTCNTTADGNLLCGACPRGYNGTGIGPNGCIDINECQVRLPSGLCDIHTNCSNTPPGSYTCSACPNLYSGLGNETCTPLCGNKNCEPELGEDCVSCPLDCSAPCGKCGDNFCDSGELCGTCPDDCGTCHVLKCPDASCSHHGSCIQGQCFCTGSWGGPSCDTPTGNFSLNVTGSNPGFILTTTNANNSAPLVFTISFREIREITPSQVIVSSINLTSEAFEFLPYNNTNNQTGDPNKACSNCDLGFYIHTSSSTTNNKQFTSSVTLNNGAYLELMILDIEDPTTVTFATTSTNFASKTIKLAAQIRNWPFSALQNSLALILDPVASDNGASCVNTQKDENDNLKWVTINYGGISLYGQFTDKMIVDGIFRQVSFKFESTNTISALIPHFWVNAVLDPAFSVLLDPNNKNCGKSDNKKWVKIVAIVVPICVVFVVLLVAFLLLLPRIRTFFEVNKWNKGKKKEKVKSDNDLKMEHVSSDRPLVIDHNPSYSVGTASGFYSFDPNRP